jgi:hypothetical protein
MNKEQFYRKDLSTFKPKYYLFCREKRIETEISLKSVAQMEFKSYIRTIKITEL